MVLRQKLSIRAAAAAWFGFCVWGLVDEPTRQAAVSVVVAVLLLAASLRALIVVRDDTVYRRGLMGWKREPLLLEELTAVSLRREFRAKYFALVLRLSGPDGTEMTIECWTWTRWRDLAHRAGHFARQVDARRDDVTARRMACTRAGCAWESHAQAVVAGRRAGSPPNDDLSTMDLFESVGIVAALFAVGFAFGLFGGWFRTDLDTGPLVPFALASGGLFALAGVAVVMWGKIKAAFTLPPASPRPPHH